MNKIKNLFIILLFLIAEDVLAQGSNIYSGNNIMIQITPVYQSWNIDNENSISEVSNSLRLNYYANRSLSFSVSSGYALIGGDYGKMNGLTDSQFSLKYHLRKQSIVFDAGVNIPNGKESLNAEEFETSRMMGHDLFGLRIPSLGQGLNIYLGGVWAYPISDKLVIGLGSSYQIKGSFEPVDYASLEYSPSNELLITGGLDYRFDKASNISMDISAVFYGNDQFDGEDAYSSGNRILLNLMFRRYIGFNEVKILLRYRNQTKGEFLGEYITPNNEKYNPNVFAAKLNFRQKISSNFKLGYEIEGRIYEETFLYHSGYNVYGFGFSPELKFQPNITLTLRAKYFIGHAVNKDSINGFETGLYLSTSL